MLEWLIAALVIINVVFLSIIFFFLKIKETKIDPMTLSLMGSGDPKKIMMMQMMGGKMDPMKMMLFSGMLESKKKNRDLSQELKDEVVNELRPLLKEKLKKEAEEEIKKYFKLKE